MDWKDYNTKKQETMWREVFWEGVETIVFLIGLMAIGLLGVLIWY